MSQSRQQSSSIIFQQQDQHQDNNSPFTSPHSATKLCNYNIPNMQPLQIKTKMIKVNSSLKLKNRIRNKILFDDNQIDNQSSIKIFKIDQPSFQPSQQKENYQTENQQKSQTLSNQQTKHKTLDQQQIDNAVQSINQLEEYPVQYYTQTKQKIKTEEKQDKVQIIMPPRNAKRQLGSSGDEEIREKQQEKQQEQQQDQKISENQDQYYDNSVNKKPQKPSPKAPSIQVRFRGQKLYKFVHTHMKRGYQIECTISLESGFLGIGTKYNLKQKYEPKILLSAKKQLISLSPRFLLSLNKQNHSRRHQDFIGIMQSNFSGTKWILKCPILSKREQQTIQDFQTLLIAQYNSSVLGSKSIRDVNVYLIEPQLPKTQRMKINLQTRIQTQKKKNLIHLKTAKPVLIKGKYQLDFKGLAKIPSNKNFILTDQNGNYCLVFAKQNQQSYLMNIRYPLTLSQGFSLCLASLDNKLFVN